MSKTVDKSGFWFIPHNPISKVGIFDYLGSSISDECEPNKVYKVFRSGETLLASVPTWDNPPKPFINDHEMLGEGFTEIDERPVQGVITNPQYEDGVLYADITVYSEKLKEAIENGKKELSLGYFCKFEKQPGVYEGEKYDYIQTGMVGNHIALVDAGRCGSDVKVFDQKCVMDSFDIIGRENLKKTEDLANVNNEQETETKDNAMADKREAIRKIMAIAAKPDSEFDGGEKEKIETIAKLLEESEYAKSEKGTANDEEAKKDDGEKKAEDKCGKDEEETEEKKTEDSEEEEKEVKDDDDEEKEVKDEQLSLLKKIADGIDELLKKSDEKKEEEKAEDEDDSEKKSEDEDDDKKESEDEDDTEEKEAGDGVLFTFGQDKAIDGEDPAIKAYLA